MDESNTIRFLGLVVEGLVYRKREWRKIRKKLREILGINIEERRGKRGDGLYT